MKKEYTVIATRTISVYQTVEADSEEEARAAAITEGAWLSCFEDERDEEIVITDVEE